TNVTVSSYVDVISQNQDVTGETWAYNYRAKQWSHVYDFVPEYMGKIGSSVYLFNQGRVYKHCGSETHNNYFGRQYERTIIAEVNPQPGKDKTWSSVQIDCEELCADPSG